MCKYCNKVFTTNSNYNRHVKRNCKKRKEIEDEKALIFERLLKKLESIEKENLEIRKENMEVKEKLTRITKIIYKKNQASNCHNTNNTQNNNIVNSNNNNTFVLVGCGKENIMKLDKQKIIRAVSAGFYSTRKLTDLVHFDPEHPECHALKYVEHILKPKAEFLSIKTQRHNVYIGNMKDKYAMMYDGINWSMTTKTELIANCMILKKHSLKRISMHSVNYYRRIKNNHWNVGWKLMTKIQK